MGNFKHRIGAFVKIQGSKIRYVVMTRFLIAGHKRYGLLTEEGSRQWGSQGNPLKFDFFNEEYIISDKTARIKRSVLV